jgi:hypothetical protein
LRQIVTAFRFFILLSIFRHYFRHYYIAIISFFDDADAISAFSHCSSPDYYQLFSPLRFHFQLFATLLILSFSLAPLPPHCHFFIFTLFDFRRYYAIFTAYRFIDDGISIFSFRQFSAFLRHFLSAFFAAIFAQVTLSIIITHCDDFRH